MVRLNRNVVTAVASWLTISEEPFAQLSATTLSLPDKTRTGAFSLLLRLTKKRDPFLSERRPPSSARKRGRQPLLSDGSAPILRDRPKKPQGPGQADREREAGHVPAGTAGAGYSLYPGDRLMPGSSDAWMVRCQKRGRAAFPASQILWKKMRCSFEK